MCLRTIKIFDKNHHNHYTYKRDFISFRIKILKKKTPLLSVLQRKALPLALAINLARVLINSSCAFSAVVKISCNSGEYLLWTLCALSTVAALKTKLSAVKKNGMKVTTISRAIHIRIKIFKNPLQFSGLPGNLTQKLQ